MNTWCLGGLSLLAWVGFWLAARLGGEIVVVSQYIPLAVMSFTFLNLICNHPHFMASYALAYGRGWPAIRRRWPALVAAPVLLLMIILWAFSLKDEQDHAPVLTFLVHLMLLASAWHYTQQSFGCVLLGAAREGHKVSGESRRWLRCHLWLLAGFYICWSYREMPLGLGVLPYYGLQIRSFALPLWPAIILACLTTMSGVYAYSKLRHETSVNNLVPWLAMLIWYLPLGSDPVFYLLAVPFFHSLQYLVCAFPALSKGGGLRWQYLTVVSLVFTGWLGFEAIPSLLDKEFEVLIGPRTGFWVMSAALFLNIHHFFVDSVIWKHGEGVIERLKK